MRYQRLGTTLIGFVALISWPTPAPSFEGSFRVPCEISYRGEAPFVVICAVKVTTTRGHVVEIARTPNGRAFVVKNDGGSEEWLLDHEKAVLTSEEPNPCYKNAEVQVCF